MHACIVVSLMAGVRPEEARAIGWEQDVDLDGDPPSVAVLRADRAGGVVIVATVDAAADLDHRLNLELVETRTFASRVIYAHYRRV